MGKTLKHAAMHNPILCVAATPALQRTMNFERLVRGGVNRAKSVTYSPAGKAVNVALVLQTLEARPLLTGFLGGATGQMMRDLLAARGVAERCLETPAPTRICNTVIEAGRSGVTELVEEAAPPGDDEWRALFRHCRELVPDTSMMILAGALPPQSPLDIYAMFARAAREAGKPVLIDSQKQPLLSALPHGPLLAKLNAYEVGLTFGREMTRQRDVIEAAQEIQHRGAKWVLVTNGAKPALLVGEHAIHQFTPPRLRAVNAVGSGDATTAGIAAALAAGEDMPSAVTLGLACGAANALTLTPADVDPAKARELRAQIGMKLL